MNNIIILENTTVKGFGIMIAFDEDRKKKLANYIGRKLLISEDNLKKILNNVKV